ncbi:hypothetical protein CKA32_002571 [Geitlerinema sp. FC II]|nr:hypothetical protein CKA32_002571 [Geitlerinema sp. FC II]
MSAFLESSNRTASTRDHVFVERRNRPPFNGSLVNPDMRLSGFSPTPTEYNDTERTWQ